jgi:hypothetical protein
MLVENASVKLHIYLLEHSRELVYRGAIINEVLHQYNVVRVKDVVFADVEVCRLKKRSSCGAVEGFGDKELRTTYIEYNILLNKEKRKRIVDIIYFCPQRSIANLKCIYPAQGNLLKPQIH